MKMIFNSIHNQPGQAQIDQYIMSHSWAYAVGQWAATYFTAVCGGCGGAAWSAYYSYEATGSVNAALRSGGKTYVTTYAFSYVDAQYGRTWNMERVMVTSFVGGATSVLNGGSFKTGFESSFVISAITYANVAMRADEVEKSKINPDNLDSSPGCSGSNGDGVCIAGSRHECETGVLCDPAHHENYLRCDSPAGGCQGGAKYDGDVAHRLGPIPCGSGTKCQILSEAFAGPHDWLRDYTGFSYDEFGNSNHFTGFRLTLDTIHLYVSIPVAAPFAAGVLIGTTYGGQAAVQSMMRRKDDDKDN